MAEKKVCTDRFVGYKFVGGAIGYLFRVIGSEHPSRKLTEEKYLAIERQAEEKNEYLGGEMFAIAGANCEHNLFLTNRVINFDGPVKSPQARHPRPASSAG